MIRKLIQLQCAAWKLALKLSIIPVTVLLSRTDRHLVWRLWEVCFGSQRPGVYPEIRLTDIINKSTSTKVVDIPAEPYNVTSTELLALAAITSQLGATTVFEFGTADGRTTRNLAANIDLPGRVYTINLPLDEDSGHKQNVPVGFRFQDCPEVNYITQIWGDTKTFDFSPYFGCCQVIFIDADHSEAGVLADSDTAMKLVDSSRGIVIWHDALAFGVQKALPGLIREKKLPIYLINGTNLAILCFANQIPVPPHEWVKFVDLPGKTI